MDVPGCAQRLRDPTRPFALWAPLPPRTSPQARTPLPRDSPVGPRRTALPALKPHAAPTAGGQGPGLGPAGPVCIFVLPGLRRPHPRGALAGIPFHACARRASLAVGRASELSHGRWQHREEGPHSSLPGWRGPEGAGQAQRSGAPVPSLGPLWAGTLTGRKVLFAGFGDVTVLEGPAPLGEAPRPRLQVVLVFTHQLWFLEPRKL